MHKKNSWILPLVIGVPIVSFIGFIAFILGPNQVKGSSMAPNYIDGQYLLTNKIVYINSDPIRGDVIIFSHPQKPEYDYIQRIIALPGETIDIKEGRVYINGQILEEKYLSPNTETFVSLSSETKYPVTVPSDNYFTMGDNRPYSSDSRIWGFLSRKNIIGKVAFCYWNCSK